MINVKLGWFIQDRRNIVSESVPGPSVHSSYKVKSGLIQIQISLFTRHSWLFTSQNTTCQKKKISLFPYNSLHRWNRNIRQAPFSDDTASNTKGKKINRYTIVSNTCMILNCSINFHLVFYKISVRTDRHCRSNSDCTDCSRMFDLHYLLILRIYFFKKYNFENGNIQV